MKFCTVVPEICRGQVHGPRKERKENNNNNNNKDPKVFRFVVKGVKAIFFGVQRGWGLL
jgi:hypothetical protein